MVKINRSQPDDQYECEACGFRYADDPTSLITGKEWAEKCEVWCKEHNSCNIEITGRAIDQGSPPTKNAESDAGDTARLEAELLKEKNIRFIGKVFYGAVGVLGSRSLLLLFYRSLNLNSSVTSLINNTKGEPVYLWVYGILTLGAVVLFGIDSSLFVYRWKRFGPPRFRQAVGGLTGRGLGTLVGVVASACPVCGSALLAAVGIAGGLAAFPFQGLELKTLSFGLLVSALWFLMKDIRALKGAEDGSICEGDACIVAQKPSFQGKDIPILVAVIVLAFIVFGVNWNMFKAEPIAASILPPQQGQGVSNISRKLSPEDQKLFDEVSAKVLPAAGIQSKIALRDSMVKLVEFGVIDLTKITALYEKRGGIPKKIQDALAGSADAPILLTKESPGYYVNFLWALGLANYMSSNQSSPIAGGDLFNFASTGGWNLGKEENGGAYFNKFKVVALTPDQEALVTRIAQNTYRPCCNNSTFFQDCNHGSALLGLLQLGASQGLSENELYREALAFNSFWFPNNYLQTALYFKAVENTDWEEVDPRVVMGKEFSTISGWSKVAKEVQERNLMPRQEDGASCGV